jgi:serine/threonine-protein kinase RsbW
LSGEPAHTPARENKAVLRVDTGPIGAPVLARVVAMMLARADCPVDKLDDALLICDTLAAHAPAHSYDGHVEFTIATQANGLQLRVGALVDDGAKRLLQDAELPGVGNVLEPITDSVRIESSGGDGSDELVLELRFDPALAPRERSGAPRA